MDVAFVFAGLLLLVVLGTVAFRGINRAGSKGPLVVGFFHPYCAAGGGGERVLWRCIQRVQALNPSARCVVYTGDTEPSGQILSRAKERFNLTAFSGEVQFVRLKKRYWVEASPYPRFTLLGQSLGSLLLGWEALTQLTPHVFVDTMGYAFTHPLARLLFGCKVACYVHYPTISTDMLNKVREQRATYNNDARISGNVTLSSVKLLYYKLFAALYSAAGRLATVVMVNSSWTAGHVRSLWGDGDRVHRVYPPCDTSGFQTNPLRPLGTQGVCGSGREPMIVSVAQFRPEKDHMLQLEAFSLFVGGKVTWREGDAPDKDEASVAARRECRLVMVGGVRGDEDQARVDALKARAEALGVRDRVTFLTNAPYAQLKDQLRHAHAGLHTMWNEHFGIGVVELMAAGVVTIAHNSAGPKMDIVVPQQGQPTGFLASTAKEYARALSRAFSSDFCKSEALDRMREAARSRVDVFSDQGFAEGFDACMEPLLQHAQSALVTNSGKQE